MKAGGQSCGDSMDGLNGLGHAIEAMELDGASLPDPRQQAWREAFCCPAWVLPEFISPSEWKCTHTTLIVLGHHVWHVSMYDSVCISGVTSQISSSVLLPVWHSPLYNSSVSLYHILVNKLNEAARGLGKRCVSLVLECECSSTRLISDWLWVDHRLSMQSAATLLNSWTCLHST